MSLKNLINIGLLKKNYFIDSREVKENSVFICIKGKNDDGHRYINEVLSKFKKTLVIGESKSSFTKTLKKNERVILCKSTLGFIQDLSKIKRFILNKNVFICITGSSGKTTLKDNLHDILKTFDRTYKSKKSYNNHIGLPLTLANQKEKSIYNVYEAGMNSLGEIDNLTKILRPNIGIITNIGDAHIGKLGSQNNIFKAKSEIINNIEKNGTLILNGDCAYFKKLTQKAKNKKLKILSFGNKSQFTISFKVLKNNLVQFKLRNKTLKLKLLNIQNYNIQNICVILLILNLFKLNLNKAVKKIKSIKSIKGRGNLIKYKKNISIIDDSYNSNPTSLKNAIYSFANMQTKKNKILVLGDMLELGKFSSHKHKEIGSYLNKFDFKKIFTVGKESKNIFMQLNKNIRGKSFNNINELNKEIKNVLVENSIILFKSSNSIGLNKLLNKKIY